jgi:predicted DNA-binding antitoxin AbrB/MazE fold protein
MRCKARAYDLCSGGQVHRDLRVKAPGELRGEEMHRLVDAIYENGVLRPLETLVLPQNQRVTLQIDLPGQPADEMEDKGFMEYCRSEGDPAITLDEVRKALGVIPGSMTEACAAERDED